MDDVELVLAARAGDREAYGVLIERHGARVRALCYRVAGNVADAEELAHDSFVEAYLKLEQLREPARFAAWLRRIALNLCRMWHRRRPPELGLDEGGAALLEPSSEPEPLSEPEADAEELARLGSALVRLRTPHRIVLALHHLEGLSYDEIAAFLDVPVGTVMSRLHRARRTLREALQRSRLAEEPYEMSQDTTMDRLKRDIEHEIGVLLDAFGDGRGPAERLRVLLQHTPERFVQLIRSVDRRSLERLGALLPGLGARGVELSVALALGDEPDGAVRARSVLAAMLARCQSSSRGGYGDMPAREAYLLVDQIWQRQAPAADTAQLLLELLPSAPVGPVASLLLQALLCQRDEAMALLLERYAAAADPSRLQSQPYVLYGLCRLGGDFCRHLLAQPWSLRSRVQLAEPAATGQHDQLLMAGVEALSLCLKLPRRPGDAGLEDVRSAERYAPLTAAELEAGAYEQLVARAAQCCEDPRAELQEAGLRVLANLGARDRLAQARALLDSPRLSTRCQALYTLGELGDQAAADAILEAAQSGPAAQRCAALSTVARLKLQAALPLLRQAVHEPQSSVQAAAVAALGELGSEAGDALLHELMHHTDAGLARLAVDVVFSRAPSQAPWPGSALAQQRLARLRGDAQPFCRDSLGASMRFAVRGPGPHEEQALTRALAQVCSDYAAARRHLIEQGLMTRSEGNYALTPLGAAIQRVELRILKHAIAPR